MPVNSRNNELAGGLLKALTKNSNSPILIFYTLISRSTLIAISVPAPGPTFDKHINKNLQRPTKLILKLFFQSQEYAQSLSKVNQDNGPQK